MTLFLVATLDEFKVRELNDLINKRFREKRMWEERIKELGGPDYSVRCLIHSSHLQIEKQAE